MRKVTRTSIESRQAETSQSPTRKHVRQGLPPRPHCRSQLKQNNRTPTRGSSKVQSQTNLPALEKSPAIYEQKLPEPVAFNPHTVKHQQVYARPQSVTV